MYTLREKSVNTGKGSNQECYKTPAVDILESENSFTIFLNLPGVKKEDLNIKLEENLLTVTGKVNPSIPENSKYILRERRTGDFRRHFRISDAVLTDNIEAKFENGVLEIVLPKSPEKQPKSITIK